MLWESCGLMAWMTLHYKLFTDGSICNAQLGGLRSNRLISHAQLSAPAEFDSSTIYLCVSVYMLCCTLKTYYRQAIPERQSCHHASNKHTSNQTYPKLERINFALAIWLSRGVHYHHRLLCNWPTVAWSTDCCAIDRSLRYRQIRRMRSAIGRWCSAIARSRKSVVSAQHK